MSNPLFEALGKNPMINAFNQFKSTLNGNPETIVRNLLSSGQMTQAQFNQLSAQANDFAKMLK